MEPGRGHLRMTEKSRLAIAAAAMKQRMTTLSKALVLGSVSTLPDRPTALAAMMALVKEREKEWRWVAMPSLSWTLLRGDFEVCSKSAASRRGQLELPHQTLQGTASAAGVLGGAQCKAGSLRCSLRLRGQ